MAVIPTSSFCGTILRSNPCPAKQSSLQLIGACVTGRGLPTYKLTSRSSSFSTRAVVAAASSAVEAQQQTPAASSSKVLPFRVGHGFDLHRLEPGYPLIIGGIDIPHDRGCEAHSDGDVLLHCVVDAILGALGLPDIGQIFPDTDPKWKGAPSSVFIKEAVSVSLISFMVYIMLGISSGHGSGATGYSSQFHILEELEPNRWFNFFREPEPEPEPRNTVTLRFRLN